MTYDRHERDLCEQQRGLDAFVRAQEKRDHQRGYPFRCVLCEERARHDYHTVGEDGPYIIKYRGRYTEVCDVCRALADWSECSADRARWQQHQEEGRWLEHKKQQRTQTYAWEDRDADGNIVQQGTSLVYPPLPSPNELTLPCGDLHDLIQDWLRGPDELISYEEGYVREVMRRLVPFYVKAELERNHLPVNDHDLVYEAAFIGEKLVVQLKGAVEARVLERQEVRYPADWRQAFKERWFPAWALCRWPVKHEVVCLETLAKPESK